MKIHDKVYLHGRKDEEWEIVDFTDTFHAVSGQQMVHVISDGKMTFIEKSKLSLVDKEGEN